MTVSDTVVEKPFSVADAATAAVPRPTAVSMQLVRAKDEKRSMKLGIKNCRNMGVWSFSGEHQPHNFGGTYPV